MNRALVISALLTGLFCVGFSIVVGALMVSFPYALVLLLAFVSGSAGRVFSYLVYERSR